MFINELSLGTG
jgi:hypothetical protein